jgi:opacity protein-like surface antigen
MKRLSLISILTLLVGSLAASTASAQDATPGFYGRISLGGSYAKTGFAAEDDSFGSLGDDNASIGGGALSYDAAIGFELPINLAIHGSYRGWVAPSPKYEIGGNDFEIEDTRFALHNFGGGITFSPGNFFLSWMLGPAFLKYKYDPSGNAFDVTGSTRDDNSWGIGSEVGLGATFFSAGVVELGLAGFASFHWIAETRDSEKGLLGYQAGARLFVQF